MTEKSTIEFPTTRQALTRARWQHVSFGICKGLTCKKRIEWWKTLEGAWMPLEKVFDTDANIVAPHWTSCPDAQSFKKPTDEAKPAPAAKQTELF
jgi:hypothetical protein